mgnify:CR=1 FL=1
MPGAFTPTCSSQQLPGYEDKYDELKKYVDLLNNKFQYDSASYLSNQEMKDYFQSPYYKSAMYDSECSQIHPLNYCLGLAKELLKLKFNL